MKLTVKELVKQCVEAFKTARESMLEAAALLYSVREQNAWEGPYSSFTEFLEDGCGVSRGYGSRLLSAYEHYVVKGGVSQRNLKGIDHEKLYLASTLPGSVDEQLVKAQTLTRSELKAERRDEEPCDEHTPISICSKCHAKIS